MPSPEVSTQTVHKQSLLERLRNRRRVLFDRNYDNMDPRDYELYVNKTGDRERIAKSISSLAITQLSPITASGEKAHVLDVAAGTGIISRVLEKVGYAVTATDLSQRALDHLHDVSPSIPTKKADMNEVLPFADGSFNVVTSVWGNRFIKDSDKFLNEVHRVLMSGGVFIWPIFSIEQPFWKNKNGLAQHTSTKSLARDAQNAGFSDVQIIEGGHQKPAKWLRKHRFIIAKK